MAARRRRGTMQLAKPADTPAIRAATIVLLILIDLPLGAWLFPGDSLTARLLNEGLFWFLTAAIVAFVVFVERRSLSSIGFRKPTWRTLLFGVAGGLVMTAAIAFVYLVIYPLFHTAVDIGAGTPASAMPYWLNVIIVIRAAVFEEVFYRGFAIERLTEFTGRRWLAAVISLLAFTYAHLSSWGWMHLLVAGVGGVALTALYLWRRDLASNMVAHFVTDGIGFLL
jgi:uncharacterized protein